MMLAIDGFVRNLEVQCAVGIVGILRYIRKAGHVSLVDAPKVLVKSMRKLVLSVFAIVAVGNDLSTGMVRVFNAEICLSSF
jgi:hypothetical protein